MSSRVYDRVTAEQRHDLEVAIDSLGFDERAVLLRLAKRLVLGRRQYGELNIAKDSRDWMAELLAEQLDAAIYSSIALIRADQKAK